MDKVQPLEVAGVRLAAPRNRQRDTRLAKQAIADGHRSANIVLANRLEGKRLRKAQREAAITTKRHKDIKEAARLFLAEYDKYAAIEVREPNHISFKPDPKIVVPLRIALGLL